MEGMNGREVLKHIAEVSPHTKTIFISAYSDAGKTKTGLLRDGAYAFLEKPIASLKELEYLVNQAAKSDQEKGVDMIKLLVVDDEVDICDFVKNFFKERKFEVFVAYNGKDALSIVEAREPDIILLDMKMPEMDGLETLRGIKRLNKETKVIMVTAVEDEDKIEAAKDLGAIEYIKKPLLLEQLERSVLMIAEQLRTENK
jgi:two-component system response regulator (stage 0 sporulation protein F)